jgi:2-succinyl-5-enolpyruvyl-6-hydroxy-3-cyclohexene-1-carboxylate synthase
LSVEAPAADAAFALAWREAEARAVKGIKEGLKRESVFVEPQVTATLAERLPEKTPLFVANSMPVRDLEYFWPANTRGVRMFFSRGANGIDGTLSTALGVAHGNAPAVLLTGDLALLHDTNGFLSVPQLRGSLTIVLVNNGGGGIFNHLPVAQFNPPFEKYWATPQSVDFAKLCAAYGVEHVAVTDGAQLARMVAKLPATGVRVLEVRTERVRDAAFRKALFADVAAGLGG